MTSMHLGPPIAVSGHAADVFADLYDALDRANVGELSLERTREAVRTEPRLRWTRQWTTDQLLRVGHLTGAPVRTEAAALAVLKGIADVLGDLDRWSTANDELDKMRLHYLETGRLNITADGAVLPCRPEPTARHTRLRRFIPGLIRVSQHTWGRTRLVRPRLDPFASIRPPHAISVASVPWYTQPTEVLVGHHELHGEHWYSVAPAPGLDRDARVDDAIAAFDACGAVIGLVPELTLDPETMSAWQRRLGATAAGARASASRLEWVLIGSGDVTPVVDGSTTAHEPADLTTFVSRAPTTGHSNTAVLMTREGCVVAAQDKTHGFTMEPWYLDQIGWTSKLCNRTHRELLDTPDVTTVVQTSHGLLTVVICEDSGRAEIESRVLDLGAAIVLFPVFAKLIPPGAWSVSSATTLAGQGGARVALVNSRCLEFDLDPEKPVPSWHTMVTVRADEGLRFVPYETTTPDRSRAAAVRAVVETI